MTRGDALPPVAVEATDAAGAEVIEAFVARRRAELARLSLAARTARQRCDRAETELSAVTDVDADGVPADLLGVVDAMLEKAVAASELALASAEREASFIVDRALADGADMVRRAGLDPSVLASVRSPGLSAPAVTPPPTAVELWHRTRPLAAPSRPAPSWPPTSTPSASGPVPPQAPSSPRSTLTTPLPPPLSSAPGPSASAPFVPVVVPDRGGVEPGAAFDDFWQEASGERRVRDRLLRRSPKESA